MADTRTRPQRIDGNAEVQDLAPVDLDASAQRLDSFPELLQALNAVPDSARPDIATRLNDVLIAMRAPGHETEEAELVMEALSSKELHDAIDTRGRSCRKEAVQTMMACGFPHALMLDPDDMAFMRAFVDKPVQSDADPVAEDDALAEWELAMLPQRRAGAAVMLAMQAISLVSSIVTLPSLATQVPVVVLSVVGMLSAAALGLTRPRSLNIATFGGFATLLGLGGVTAALVMQSWLVAIAPIGVALGLFVSIAGLYEELADPPDRDDWDYDGYRVRTRW